MTGRVWMELAGDTGRLIQVLAWSLCAGEGGAMRRFLPLLLLLLFVAQALAEELSVKPGINDKFLDPALKVEEWTEKFETESREIFHQRNKIVAAIGLKPGMKTRDT